MVERQKKTNRKFLGSRRWGVGNIKNNRGKGSRGGVGRGGIKHKWSRTVLNKEQIGSHGFNPWHRKRLNEIDLDSISRKAAASTDSKPTIELKGFKVLSSGKLSRPAVIKATAFSEKAMEKIKSAGGEAVKL